MAKSNWHMTRHEVIEMNTRLVEENEKLKSQVIQLKWDYMLAQSHIGTLLAINNKYHAHHVRYGTYDKDYFQTREDRGYAEGTISWQKGRVFSEGPASTNRQVGDSDSANPNSEA